MTSKKNTKKQKNNNKKTTPQLMLYKTYCSFVLLDVILFHTYMRNFDLDLLALLFYYFGISHWFY